MEGRHGMEAEDTTAGQKKKHKKFRLFGKKKSTPDPNCPQCNPQLVVAMRAKARQQDLLHQQQQQREANDTTPDLAEDEVPCECPQCQRNRSEQPLTVELLPMDTQVTLQHMMQDAAFMCNLL
ncbi:uncharacterized protein LOC135399977 [Ornithodoros turicata]|uniref:uncharacterized protein LOC135399977 n=1 Tax=Ornithodoros turicata TaxID=34597 RepID=UPI0031393535